MSPAIAAVAYPRTGVTISTRFRDRHARLSGLRSPRGGGRANRTKGPRGVAQIAIRSARLGDGTAIARLLTDLGYPTGAREAQVRIERLQAEPATRVLVAESAASRGVVGLVAIRAEALLEHDRPVARLLALVVAENHRRRGVARALVEVAEREARTLGCFRIVLTSADRRADAHAFYLTAGYERTGARFAKELAPPA